MCQLIWLLPRWGCKAVIWCSFLGVASTSAPAQSTVVCPDIRGDCPKARHEIGVNGLGLVHFIYDPLYPRPKDPQVSVLNGISYKRRVGRNAYRLSMDVFRDAFESRQGSRERPGYYSAAGRGVRAEVRLGYEVQFTSGRLRPYAAADIVGRHEWLRLNGEGWGDLAWQREPEQYGYNITTMRYGPAISIGLSFRISK